MTKIINKKPERDSIESDYIDKQEFYEVIVGYKEACTKAELESAEKPPIPEYCGKAIMDIAEHYSWNRKFMGYSYRDVMVSDAIMDCIKYFDNFNEKKYKNPLAYFTRICHFAFINRINLEEEVRYSMYKSFDMTLNTEDAFMLDDETNLINNPVYEQIQEFIQKFEDKMERRKQKKKERMRKKREEDRLAKENEQNE